MNPLSKGMARHLNGQRGGRENRSVDLTTRQYQIALLIAEGKTSREIASTLSISPRTVGTHRRSINDRLSIRNVAELMQWLMEQKKYVD